MKKLQYNTSATYKLTYYQDNLIPYKRLKWSSRKYYFEEITLVFWVTLSLYPHNLSVNQNKPKFHLSLVQA